MILRVLHIFIHIYLIFLTLPPNITANGTSFTVGTVLFTPSDIQRECWTQENMALLTTRMLMANLMPHTEKIKADDDSFVSDIIEYFRLLLEVIRSNTSGKTKHIMLLAATDTMGGYMKHLVVPISKYAYYAGNIQYASIIRLYQLYDELKNFLRTNGDGWAKPWRNAGRHIQAKSISVQSPSPTSDPCKGIIYYKHTPTMSSVRKAEHTETKSCGMDVPLPFFDSKTHPAAIAVPFRTFGLRNLESRVSAYILVKYFVAVSKCMAARNTNDEDVHKFNANIFSFIVSKVMPHLGDEKFYAAFGGVLRILQTVTETTKAKGHAIGNINIMPETQDREPPDMKEDEDIALSKGGSGGSKKNGDRSRNNLILLAALATIIVWFCLGAAFVCCRIKAGKMRDDKSVNDDENVCRESTCPVLSAPTSASATDNEHHNEHHTKVLYSVKRPKKKEPKRKEPKSTSSHKSNKSSSKSSKSQKSGLTNTTEMDSETIESPSLISRTPSSTNNSPVVLQARAPTRDRPGPNKDRVYSFTQIRGNSFEKEPEMTREDSMLERRLSVNRERRRQTEEEEREEIEEEFEQEREVDEEERETERIQEEEEPTRDETNDRPPQLQVHSVQYYPPTFACHTSMTGKIKLDSTSEDYTSRDDDKRPYVFGYDFQTTSDETTPRDPTTDGENDMAGNMSR
ncbi:uncharacterized protein [Atheta coriaria]|uniref:uncharacterized protein isoform X2 n=1 Tax=Dalotia coriaria TaxID=877792 RepID=UPI0031F43E6D